MPQVRQQHLRYLHRLAECVADAREHIACDLPFGLDRIGRDLIQGTHRGRVTKAVDQDFLPVADLLGARQRGEDRCAGDIVQVLVTRGHGVQKHFEF